MVGSSCSMDAFALITFSKTRERKVWRLYNRGEVVRTDQGYNSINTRCRVPVTQHWVVKSYDTADRWEDKQLHFDEAEPWPRFMWLRRVLRVGLPQRLPKAQAIS